MRSCSTMQYAALDEILESELKNGVTVENIIFGSPRIPFWQNDYVLEDGPSNLSKNEHFNIFNKEIGMYTIWAPTSECLTCKGMKYLLIYVGKTGEEKYLGALGRVKSHIQKKFQVEDEILTILYICRNRLSKYYEQAFLDVYNTEYNTAENRGTLEMYICLQPHERYGTNSDQAAYRYSEKAEKNSKLLKEKKL